ncbi:MAG: hypothetical protein EOO01_36955, partial [Chitinophagaceae bacterium]
MKKKLTPIAAGLTSGSCAKLAGLKKHKAIMTPEDKMYFNHAQFVKEDSLTANKFSPLIDVYNYEPVP